MYSFKQCCYSLFNVLFISLLAGMVACSSPSPKEPEFYKVGHRGARGLVPENTIPSMKSALQAGANTLEFDVHVTGDRKIIVYHDASPNPAFSSLPDGELNGENRDQFMFYQMDYEQVRRFKVVKHRDGYEDQEDISTPIPLLTTMIDSVEAYGRRNDLDPVHYLLEIKSSPGGDGNAHPEPQIYADILMETLKAYLPELADRLIIQSFDKRPLKVIRQKYPDLRYGFLTGDKSKSINQQVAELGFKPDFFNPYFENVDPELLEACHARQIQVIPWTVNEADDMDRLKMMGVDGIITDYPNRL